jgi:hypothetical protein
MIPSLFEYFLRIGPEPPLVNGKEGFKSLTGLNRS